MKILVIGATGTIGGEIVRALEGSHEVIGVSRKGGGITADIRDAESVREMYRRAGTIDAVLCAAGSGAWKPLAQLSEEDFAASLSYKLMGQVNVIRYGLESLADNGSIAVTTGILARTPMQGSAAISMVNAGLEGFVRAASLEAPRGVRVNAVSPPWVSETLEAMGQDPSGGLPAAVVAEAYLRALEGSQNGEVIEVQ
jgi:NAD(P)-dependent dehydrogenase (short-subunit alcohol dehydrogenase family)